MATKQKRATKTSPKSAKKAPAKSVRQGAISKRTGNSVGASKASSPQQFCALPQVKPREFPVGTSPLREALIQNLSKRWVNGTVLHYYFFASGRFAGSEEEIDFVREAFEIWRDVGIGLQFAEAGDIDDAEIRIGFLQGDGAWSYLGRDALDIPGQQERTMNFGWAMAQDSRGVDVAVHEIGHTLGFPHEHQNPFAGIVWDEAAVFRHFAAAPNFWDQQTTFHNVLKKLSASAVTGSEWDADSIMHYGFPGGLISSPVEFSGGIEPALGLSAHDKAEVRRMYPPIEDSRNPKLEPFELERLNLEPGGQANFRVEPEHSRRYTIQTVGEADTLLVLFELVDEEFVFVAGDDDSGTELNASIATRLHKGKQYVLRVRFYLNHSSGVTNVLMF